MDPLAALALDCLLAARLLGFIFASLSNILVKSAPAGPFSLLIEQACFAPAGQSRTHLLAGIS